jgi:hypothetical protein
MPVRKDAVETPLETNSPQLHKDLAIIENASYLIVLGQPGITALALALQRYTIPLQERDPARL